MVFGILTSNKSSEILFHFPPQPARLLVRKRKNTEEVEQISLQTLFELKCSSFFSDFYPVWWLFNGQLQTLYNIYGDFSKCDQLWYRRQLIRLADGGTLGLDFTHADHPSLTDDVPIVVIKHGLTGGSHEHYLRTILAPACAPVEKGGLGYRGVVVTFRGCAGVPITTPRLYTAGHTDDLRQALMYISYKYPRARLLGVGFSLGGNVMTRYVAEEGEQSRLSSACIICCPWNMEKNGHALESTWLGKNLWSKGMGMNLQELLKRHIVQLRETPATAQALDSTLGLKYPTLRQFDDTFTRHIGDSSPPFPFPTVGDYYLWGSSDHVVKDIKVPFLAINSQDDPVVIHSPMNSDGSPYVIMGLTKRGGHLGWFQSSKKGGERWITKPVIEWLQLMGEEVVHGKLKAAPVYEDENGYLKEEGKDHLGCKGVEGGNLIDGNAGDQGLLQGL